MFWPNYIGNSTAQMIFFKKIIDAAHRSLTFSVIPLKNYNYPER
jgi:hypothetical protein